MGAHAALARNAGPDRPLAPGTRRAPGQAPLYEEALQRCLSSRGVGRVSPRPRSVCGSDEDNLARPRSVPVRAGDAGRAVERHRDSGVGRRPGALGDTRHRPRGQPALSRAFVSGVCRRARPPATRDRVHRGEVSRARTLGSSAVPRRSSRPRAPRSALEGSDHALSSPQCHASVHIRATAR